MKRNSKAWLYRSVGLSIDLIDQGSFNYPDPSGRSYQGRYCLKGYKRVVYLLMLSLNG